MTNMLRIGDSLFRFCSNRGVWRYEIISIIKTKKTKEYELITDACGHSCDGCRIYVNTNTLKAVRAEGPDDADMWHVRASNLYRLTKKEAEMDMYGSAIRNLEVEIKRSEKIIEINTQKIKEYEEKLKSL